ncbi:MAG: BLUF domain-containing protein [Pseudomonadota bacterium]
MLQLVYVSSAAPGLNAAEPAEILAVSRRNNRSAGITGLLYSDARRFLQVLEGPTDTVEQAFARIAADPRHRAIVVLSRRDIDVREFGEWEMAHRQPGSDADIFVERVAQLTAGAAPNIRATFEGFAQFRRAS